MLITFSCNSHSNVTMFGDVAIKMIKMMGYSELVPGAISAQDVPKALSRLTTALSEQEVIEEKNSSQEMEDNEGQEEQIVSLGLRGFPLVELLKSATKDECEVVWDAY